MFLERHSYFVLEIELPVGVYIVALFLSPFNSQVYLSNQQP